MNGKHHKEVDKKISSESVGVKLGILLLAFSVVMMILCITTKITVYDTNPSPTTPSATAETVKVKESAAKDMPVEQSTISLLDGYDTLIVNKASKLPDDYTVELIPLENGLEVSSECYQPLLDMLSDCKESGCEPVVCSAYRSIEEQRELFDDKVAELMRIYNYTEHAASYEAEKVVAYPGCSEHQTGLAVDIVDIENQNLEEYQEDTDTQQWLIKNSWKYGFILRYPDGKSKQTGVTYEPWHYRYVGTEVAKAIHDSGLCLEEYLVGPGYFDYD